MFKQARMQLGLTQAKMADAMGVSVVAVSQWERGGNNPSSMAVKLLDALVFLHSLGKLEEFKTFHYTGQEITQQVARHEEKKPRKLTAKEQKHLDEAKRRLEQAQRMVDTGDLIWVRHESEPMAQWVRWHDPVTGADMPYRPGDSPMQGFRRWLAKGIPVYPPEWAAWGLDDEEMAYIAMMQGQDWPKEKVMRYVQVRRDG